MLQRGPALILRVRVRVLLMMRMLLRVLDLVRMRVVQRRPGRMLLLLLLVVMMIAITTLRTGLEDVGCALLLMIQPGIEVFSSPPAHLPPVLLLLVLQEGIGTATAAGTSTNAHPRRRIPLRWRCRTLLLLRTLLRMLPMGARPRTPSSSSHRDGLGLLERDGLGVIHGRLLRSRGGATARAPALLATSGGTVRRRTHTGLIRLLLLLIRSLAVLRVLALLLLVLLLQTVVALGWVRDGRRRRRRGRAPASTVAPTASTAAGWASTSSWHPRGRRGVGPEGRPLLLLLLRLESSSSAAASGRAGAGPGPQHPVALVVRACRVLLKIRLQVRLPASCLSVARTERRRRRLRAGGRLDAAEGRAGPGRPVALREGEGSAAVRVAPEIWILLQAGAAAGRRKGISDAPISKDGSSRSCSGSGL
mmetsp:Transcript_12552/g.29726  ORF Transcript_12552/g.29726 Transcript_12552/m.29726 type:complete len:420 (-) Transcript_12552:533-1792(-)